MEEAHDWLEVEQDVNVLEEEEEEEETDLEEEIDITLWPPPPQRQAAGRSHLTLASTLAPLPSTSAAAVVVEF